MLSLHKWHALGHSIRLLHLVSLIRHLLMQIEIVLHVLSRALTTDRLFEITWFDHFFVRKVLSHSLVLLVAYQTGLSIIISSTGLLRLFVTPRPVFLILVAWSKLFVVLLSPH